LELAQLQIPGSFEQVVPLGRQHKLAGVKARQELLMFEFSKGIQSPLEHFLVSLVVLEDVMRLVEVEFKGAAKLFEAEDLLAEREVANAEQLPCLV